MKRVTKIEDFPKGDHVAVLIKEGGDTYSTKFSYNYFESLTAFKDWIKNNPTSVFVPLVAKKVEYNIEVHITNLDVSKPVKSQNQEEIIEEEDDTLV